jgi:hypothetical protein
MEQNVSDRSWTQWSEAENSGNNMMVGVVVGSAIVAGLLAYMMRRKSTPDTAADRLASQLAGERGEKFAEGSREFLMKKVVPEMRPAMLALLGELEDSVNLGFRRVEKQIKKL